MGRGVIGRVVLGVWLGGVTAAAAQLPPEVQADAYLIQVEQAIGDGNYDQAWARLHNIHRLQTDHELDLPEFYFWYAKAAAAKNLPEEALESVLRYLTVVGRKGQNYVEALKLMNKVKAVVACKGWETEGYFKETTSEAVSACLATGIDLEARNDSGRTPLHRAAAHTKNPAVIEALAKAGADLEAQDDNGHSPLVVAVVHSENLRVIETLLKAGANPKNLEQVLEASATDPKKLEQVLEPVVRHITDGGGEVQYHAEMLKFMDRVRAVTRCKGWETEEYFEIAALEEVMACLDTGVDLEARDDSGRMPLHRAAVHTDDPSVIDALLAAGADPMAHDEASLTPLHYATGRIVSLAVIEALLAAGADPMARQSREEMGQLEAGEEHAYSFFGRAGQEEILDAEAHDFNPNIVVNSPSGKKFFGSSFQWGKEILSLSLEETGEYRIRIFRYDWDGGDNTTYTLRTSKGTPLEMAVRNDENPAVVEAMLKAGADPRAENNLGESLLHRVARYNKNPAVIQVLLSNAGSPRGKDVFGRTPVHYAAFNENPAVIQILLSNAGSPRGKDVFAVPQCIMHPEMRI